MGVESRVVVHVEAEAFEDRQGGHKRFGVIEGVQGVLACEGYSSRIVAPDQANVQCADALGVVNP